MEKSFRPLTGILFFNTDARGGTEQDAPPKSFRPLTGILFFNLTRKPREQGGRPQSFRPLTGILFFNYPAV